MFAEKNILERRWNVKVGVETRVRNGQHRSSCFQKLIIGGCNSIGGNDYNQIFSKPNFPDRK